MAASKSSQNGARSRGHGSVRAGRGGASSSRARKPVPGKAPTPLRATLIVPIVVMVVLVVAAWSYYPVARLQYREQRHKTSLQAELDALKDRNSGLREQVARLKTPEGVEEVARESLGMVKQGENLYVVLDGDETATVPATAPQNPRASTPEPASWQKVLDAVFGFEE